MKQIQLGIGEVAVCTKDVTIACLGLGSCVGLFMQDVVTGVSGGAHIQLPTSAKEKVNDFHFAAAEDAIAELLKLFKAYGSKPTNLIAKITGGSLLFDQQNNIGQENVRAVVNELKKFNINLSSADTGGNWARSAYFNASTGDLKIKNVTLNQHIII